MIFFHPKSKFQSIWTTISLNNSEHPNLSVTLAEILRIAVPVIWRQQPPQIAAKQTEQILLSKL